MSKFKAGDKVRILSGGYDTEGYQDGDIIIVDMVGEENSVWRGEFYFTSSEVELVRAAYKAETVNVDIDPRYIAILECAVGVELCNHYKKLLEVIDNAS